MEITLKPKQAGLAFFFIVVLLTLIHSIVLIAFFQTDSPVVVTLNEWFDLDYEYNVPSFYSAFAILLCSALFFVIARYDKERLDYAQPGWFGLAAVFLFLSIDEAFQVHENIGDIVEGYVAPTGFLYFPWVIPYFALLMAFLLVYLRWMWKLPRRTAMLFILAGGIYITGAVVFDMLGGREAEVHGYESLSYSILYTIEEFLEMSGIVLLMYALLSYIEDQFGYIRISAHISA